MSSIVPVGSRKIEVPPSQQLIVNPNEDNFTGWREDWTDEMYHADRTAVTSSALRQVHKSAKAFYWAFLKGDKSIKKETEALRLGKIIHTAVLEGPEFRKRYVVEPVFEGRTAKGELTTSANCKEVKLAKAKWYEELPEGAIVVKGEEEREQIIEICNSIMEHPEGPSLLRGGRPEVAGFYIDPNTGIRLKIKPDFLRFDGSVLVDFKTSRDVDRFRFGSHAYVYRYDFQLFMYGKGIEAITGKFPDLIAVICVEKEPPYDCAIYYFNRELDLHQAEIDYNSALAKLDQSLRDGKWPGQQKGIERIMMPGWFKYQANIRNEKMEEIYV